MEKTKKYYLGLDIGTDSVGYAVTDEKYNLLKFHGDAAWGSTIFDAASLNAERRSFRSARRRLDRRQQRVQLLQEIFAKEISKKDERFFIRLSESYLWREDTKDRYVFFDDAEYTDVQYMSQYPTIHHLISELINNKGPHDVRLVYLACAWLVAHRGHFLSNIKADNLAGIVDIQTVYDKFYGTKTKGLSYKTKIYTHKSYSTGNTPSGYCEKQVTTWYSQKNYTGTSVTTIQFKNGYLY